MCINQIFSDSFYFAFVTMTTIGFGDYVPGQDAKDQSVSVVRFHVVFLALYAKIFELTHCNTPH